MIKNKKIKLNIIENFYVVYLIDCLIFLFGIILVMGTELSLDLILLIFVYLLSIIVLVTVFSCIIIYFMKQEYMVFHDKKVVIQRNSKNVEIPLDRIETIQYIDNRWYQLPLMYFHDGGWLYIKYKTDNNRSKVEKIRVFKATKKYLTKKLGYKIEIIPNKFTWSR